MNIVAAVARQALLQPQAPALIAGERVVNYGELMANVAAVASRLAAAGVARRDVVAIVAPGMVWHAVLTLAVAHLGAVSVPLRSEADADNAATAVRCGVKFLVHNLPDGFELAAPGIAWQLSVEHLSAQPAPAAVTMVAAEPDELCRIGFSGGTTGRPKAVKFTHRQLLLRVHLTRTLFPSGPRERLMTDLPPGLHFAFGYWLRTLMCGGAVVSTTEAQAMDDLRRHRVTFLLTSPPGAIELVKLAQREPRHVEPPPDLRTLCLAGSSVWPALQALFRRHLCRGLFINYGMTEAGGLVALADPAVLQGNPRSAGRVVPWVECEAVGPDGRPLPPGSRGLLRVRSPCMGSGYLGADAVAGGGFRDGWFSRGWGRRRGAGGLVELGGGDDMLARGGRGVGPGAVEAVLAGDPAILECVAMTMPDRRRQPQLLAVVVAPGGVDAAALKQRCLARLGAGLVPQGVVVVDRLPHNEAGKVLREEVIALIQHYAIATAASAAAGPAPAT